jgi:SAM-dependent methyltransferase
VTSRYSAHHYSHPTQALREISRVLEPSGVFLLVDVVAPEQPAADTFLNAVELLRDPSHVRDHTTAQWLEMLRQAGMTGEVLGNWPLSQSFNAWVQRMRTPEAGVVQIKALMDGAPSEVREALGFQEDYSFSLPTVLIRGKLS